MSTNEHTICPECGAPLPEYSQHQVCRACLMEQAMVSRTMTGGAGSEVDCLPVPTPEEIADKFPNFEIIECLGRGGMGVVYKARQKTLDRWVAIKILAPEREREPDFAERFAREAQTLARMNHPNIVAIFDHGETEGMFYIVMEYVDGVNLRDLLREGKMESRQALAIVPPICEALQYAHDKGVIHRDIKPENLLLDREGKVKIADFGIASLAGASGERSGTPSYMSPEQMTGTIDERADIFSLGVVLYEMLTGERPAADLVAPSKKVEVDVRIDEMVLRALEKEPERRYQTANEFRTMVKTIADTSPVEAKKEKHLQKDFSNTSPRLSVAAVIAAVLQLIPIALWGLILVILVATVYWANTYPSPEQTGNPHDGAHYANHTARLSTITIMGGLILPFFLFSVPGGILGLIATGSIKRSEGKLLGIGYAIFAVMTPLVWIGALISLAVSVGLVRLCSSLKFLEPDKVSLALLFAMLMTTAFFLIAPLCGRVSRRLKGEAKPAMRKRRLIAVSVLFIFWALLVSMFWIQRPERLKFSALIEVSTKSNYEASGSTWRRMRIFGSDILTYRFVVRNSGGLILKKQEVPAPLVELGGVKPFHENGLIRWNKDGSSVTFLLQGADREYEVLHLNLKKVHAEQ